VVGNTALVVGMEFLEWVTATYAVFFEILSLWGLLVSDMSCRSLSRSAERAYSSIYHIQVPISVSYSNYMTLVCIISETQRVVGDRTFVIQLTSRRG